jgi:hypothetical protein
LGVDQDISLDKASARPQLARSLLADGIDPTAGRQELRDSTIVLSAVDGATSRLTADHHVCDAARRP